MDNDKILDYVMNSPANTNPNVLKTMLNSGSGDSGGSLPPITVDNLGQILGVVPDFDNVSPKEVIPEQTITIVDAEVEVTADWGGYYPSSVFPAKMTFNGTEYDAVFNTDHYGVDIPDARYVHVRAESDESSTTTFVSVTDDRNRAIPGDYNISFTIMAPGVKYGLIEY